MGKKWETMGIIANNDGKMPQETAIVLVQAAGFPVGFPPSESSPAIFGSAGDELVIWAEKGRR